MGLIRNNLLFFLGSGCGIYIAQNYNVPNIKKVVSEWVLKAKQIEETYRKPKKKKNED